MIFKSLHNDIYNEISLNVLLYDIKFMKNSRKKYVGIYYCIDKHTKKGNYIFDSGALVLAIKTNAMTLTKIELKDDIR